MAYGSCANSILCLGELALPHEFRRREHERFLFRFVAGGDAFDELAVERRGSAAQKLPLRFVHEVHAVHIGLADKKVLAGLGHLLERLPRRGVEHIPRERLEIRQLVGLEERLDVDLLPERAVGEGAAEPFLQVFVACLRDTLDHAPHPLRRDFVRIVLALDQNKFAIASVFLIKSQNCVRGRARSRKRIQN